MRNMRRSAILAAVTMILAVLFSMQPANANAQDPFIGEIKFIAFNFAPRGWAFCDGQLLPIAEHTALFSLLGTTYGGDGRTTFALPDLRGRFPLHKSATGEHPLGQMGGEELVILDISEIPSHTHAAMAVNVNANSSSPAGNAWGMKKAYSTNIPDTPMNDMAIGSAGGGDPHENMPPFTTLNCIIALQGIFPSRP